MKKNIIVKVLSFIMVLALSIGTAIPVFAAGEQTIPYGGEETYIGIMNNISTNVTPVKTASPDVRTHRMILRVNFAKSALDFNGGEIIDNNGHPIKLNVYVIRSNGKSECITDNVDNVSDKYYEYKDFRTEWFSVSPGEKIQFKFDVVSNSNPTGHLRYADVQYWTYCD